MVWCVNNCENIYDGASMSQTAQSRFELWATPPVVGNTLVDEACWITVTKVKNKRRHYLELMFRLKCLYV